MADTYTSSLRIAQQTIGGNENTWGDILNASLARLDQAVAGIVSVSVTAGNVTLSTANNADDQARNALIILTGTPGVTRTVTFPDVEKLTWVYNNSDSSATLTAGAGTTVSVPAGSIALIYTDAATNAAGILIAPIGGTHVTTTASQTLTNKTITSPSIGGTVSGSATYDGITLSGATILPGSTATIDSNGIGLGVATNTVFGYAFSRSSNSIAGYSAKNTSSGTASKAGYFMENNDASADASITVTGSGWTPSGVQLAAGMVINADGAGGLALTTEDAGTTVRIGIANTQVAAFDATKLDLVLGQIKFPSSQLASADANTLDDYEEGTWTPTLGDGTNNYTLSTAVGFYTKIGNTVHCHCNTVWTSIGSAGAGQLRIGGLPFTPSGTSIVNGFAWGNQEGMDTLATLNMITGFNVASVATVFFRRVADNAASVPYPANGSSAAGAIQGSITYQS